MSYKYEGATTNKAGYMSIRMTFNYSYTVDETKRKAHVTWGLIPKSTDDSRRATYFLAHDKQHFYISVAGTKIYEKNRSPSYISDSGASSGSRVYNGYARVPSDTNTNYNGKTYFDTNGDFTGIRRWCHFWGADWLHGEFDINYKDDGTASFYVHGDFAWYNDTRRKFGETISLKTIKKKYTITYKANNGTTKKNAATTQSKIEGQTIHLFNSSNAPFTRQNYVLSSWNEKADGSGGRWALGSSYSTNAGRTLYAIWTPENYTIKFDKNTDEEVSNMPQDATKVYGKVMILPPTVPELVGRTFKCWSTSTSSDTGDEYKPSGEYKANGNATLYAIWSNNKYYITLRDYFTDESVGRREVYYSEPICSEQSPASFFEQYSKEGYEFLGWSTIKQPVYQTTPTQEELEKVRFDYNTDYMITGDTELYPLLKYTTSVYVKYEGHWRLALPFVKKDGSWKQALAFKKDGKWKL